jgi:hypothetical protein
MSKSRNNSSSHLLLKSAVVIFILAFFIDFAISSNLPVWGYFVAGATFLAISFLLIFINYTEFQRYGFLPVLLISIYEIGKHLSSGNPAAMVESLYYAAMVFISLYFIVRVTKKKYHSKGR